MDAEELSDLKNYEYVSTLGIGRFGKMFKVSSKEDGNVYAVKVIDLAAREVTFTEVIKELDVLQDIDHPNVVKIYDAISLESARGDIQKIAILMDLCEIGDLRTFIYSRKGRRFRSQTMQKWMLELSSAVGFIHSKGIMHRDIKPSNVFIDNNTSVKIGDFGVARIVLDSFAKTLIGTNAFMAPETISGCYYLEADIFSLGCVFLCMSIVEIQPKTLDGKFQAFPPKIFYGENKMSIIRRCLEGNKENRPRAVDIYNELLTDTYESLLLNNIRSANIKLAINPFVAFRDQASTASGVIFSSRPIKPGERFSMEIRKTEEADVFSSVTFGFMAKEPETLDMEKVLSVKDVQKQVSKMDCWFVCSGCEIEVRTKFTFWVEKTGDFMYEIDGKLQKSEIMVQSWRLVWAVFEIHSGIYQISLTDYD